MNKWWHIVVLVFVLLLATAHALESGSSEPPDKGALQDKDKGKDKGAYDVVGEKPMGSDADPDSEKIGNKEGDEDFDDEEDVTDKDGDDIFGEDPNTFKPPPPEDEKSQPPPPGSDTEPGGPPHGDDNQPPPPPPPSDGLDSLRCVPDKCIKCEGEEEEMDYCKPTGFRVQLTCTGPNKQQQKIYQSCSRDDDAAGVYIYEGLAMGLFILSCYAVRKRRAKLIQNQQEKIAKQIGSV